MAKIPAYVLKLIHDEQIRQKGMFVPDEDEYIKKLEEKAELLLHTEERECFGFVFFYCNDTEKKSSYITLILTLPDSRGKGVGNALIRGVLDTTRQRGFLQCHLEVKKDNKAAYHLYKKAG